MPLSWQDFARSNMGLSESQISFLTSAGFSAGIYSVSGKTVIAFAGTDSRVAANYIGWMNDMFTNTLNRLGFKDPQYSFAASFASSVAEAYGKTNVILTGHSLGGGLAAYAGASTSLQAITFNAASANVNGSAPVLNFQIGGDFARLGGTLPGQTIVLPGSLAVAPRGNSTPALDTSIFAKHNLSNFALLANDPRLVYLRTSAGATISVGYPRQ